MATEKKKKAKPQVKKQKPAPKKSALKVQIKKRVLKVAPKKEEHTHKDVESVLISTLLSTKAESHSEPRLFLASAIYSSTESMRQLAYNHGFSVGKEIYSRTSNKGIEPLLEVLESAGIGRILYMPTMDAAIIKSSTKAQQHVDAKNNIHCYEAGLISGYLSAHSSSAIITTETHCMYNSAPFCQFVSSLSGPSDMTDAVPFNLEQTLSNITGSINQSTYKIKGKGQIYLLLSILPIIKEPLLTESSKLMFLAGRIFSEESEGEEIEKSLTKLANFFDLDTIKVENAKKSITVGIRYNSHNSIDGFVDLSTKAFIGFLSKRFNSPVSFRAGRYGKSYTMTLSVTEGA